MKNIYDINNLDLSLTAFTYAIKRDYKKERKIKYKKLFGDDKNNNNITNG